MDKKTVTMSLKSILKIFILALIVGAAIATIVVFLSKNDEASRIASEVADKLRNAKDSLQNKYQEYATRFKA